MDVVVSLLPLLIMRASLCLNIHRKACEPFRVFMYAELGALVRWVS